MTQSLAISKIKEALLPFGDISETMLFGSQARGDAREDSDIDLLILLNKENVSFADESKISSPLYDIELETGIIINPIIIPRSKWGDRITPFYENVMKDRVIL